MKHIDNLLYALGQMSEYGKEYFRNEKQIIKLSIAEIAAKNLSRIITILTLILFALFLILFGSLTLSFFLASILDSYIWGFGLVALLYLIFIIVVVIFRQALITNPIVRIILHEILD